MILPEDVTDCDACDDRMRVSTTTSNVKRAACLLEMVETPDRE